MVRCDERGFLFQRGLYFLSCTEFSHCMSSGDSLERDLGVAPNVEECRRCVGQGRRRRSSDLIFLPATKTNIQINFGTTATCNALGYQQRSQERLQLETILPCYWTEDRLLVA
jgi:hypothetical protein